MIRFCTILILAFGVAGCGGNDEEAAFTAPEPVVEACQPGQMMLRISGSLQGRQRMEEALRLLGYRIEDGSDEDYGQAVRAFQQSHQLPATGDADEATESAVLGMFLDEEHIYISSSGTLRSFDGSQFEIEVPGGELHAFIVDEHTRYDGASGSSAVRNIPVGACLSVVSHPMSNLAFSVARRAGGMRVTVGQ